MLFSKGSVNERKDFILTGLYITLSVIIAYILSPYLGIYIFDGVQFERYGAKEYGLTSTKNKEKIMELFEKMGRRCDQLVAQADSIPWIVNEDTPKGQSGRLKDRWANVRLRETDPSETTIAYIVNKDHELRVCLTDKETREHEELNTAMFVILHELAHMASVKYGHGTEFWTNFRMILKKAIEMGIYEYQDYSAEGESEVYCGLTIYSTPCHDKTCNHE